MPGLVKVAHMAGVKNVKTAIGHDDFLAPCPGTFDGEQEFIYHKPVQVGQTLHQEGKVTDLYSKEAKGKTMTFLVMETVFTDDAGDPVLTGTRYAWLRRTTPSRAGTARCSTSSERAPCGPRRGRIPHAERRR